MRKIKIEKILIAAPTTALESMDIRMGIYQCFAATERWEFMYSPNDEDSLLRAARWNIDGVIGSILSARIAEVFAERNIPVVTIHAASAHPSLQLVCTDYEKEGRMAADYFVKLGYRHFAYFGSGQGSAFSKSHVIQRGNAFLNHLRELGFPAKSFPEDLEAETPSQSLETTMQQVVHWIGSLPKPAAVFCSDDLQARHLCSLCRQENLRIPEQISVLGAGNTLAHCICHPPNISSIETNYNLIGFKAAQALSRLMKNPVENPKPILVPPVQIIERDSTGTPPVGDEALTRVLAFIREHAHENPTIGEMTRLAGMSRRSLENRFKKYLGRTPFDEVRARQLERARRLLIETDYTLDEIAAMCGYSSSFYLSRLIHEKEGVPPRTFRKQFLRR